MDGYDETTYGEAMAGVWLAGVDARRDGDVQPLAAALDLDLGDTGVAQVVTYLFANLEILLEEVGVFALFRVPTRLPIVNISQPEAIRMYFSTHNISLLIPCFLL